MTTFRQELRVVPRGARITSAIVYVICAAAIFAGVHLAPSPEMRAWTEIEKILFSFGIALIVFPAIWLYGYVWGDAKRRGMRYGIWTLAAIFIPNLLGVILYFLLRDPKPRACPVDGLAVPGKFAFCPRCGAALGATCPQCGKPVEVTWSNCAHCGAKLPVGAPDAA